MSLDLSSLHFEWDFFPKLNRSLSGKFLIVGLIFGAEILRGFSSLCKLSKKLLLVFIKLSMNERCLIENKKSIASYFLK